MKTPTSQGDDSSLSSVARRQVLISATVGAGLALLPGVRALAAAVSGTARPPVSSAPSVAMGYWRHLSGAAAAAKADDVITDAVSVVPSSATYELRILNVNTDIPLSMTALYTGNAGHRFWQAWTEQGLLQHSPPSAIRWWANDKSPLALTIQVGSTVGTAEVTAQAGTYVLAIGPNAQALPAWGDLALRQKNARATQALQLVSRATGSAVAFPYAIFSVQPIVVVNAKKA